MEPMTRAEALYALDGAGISYELQEHPAVYTIEEMDKLGLSRRGTILKNLFLRDAKGRRHFLVCVPEERHADLEKLREHFGSSKLSFASEERLMNCLGLTRGAVTPLGVLHNADCSVEVAFDAALQGLSCVGVHPAENTATVWLGFDDLFQLLERHGNPVSFVAL